MFFVSIGVQYDFHIRIGSCRLAATRREPLVDQEHLTYPDHLSSSPMLTGDCVVQCLAVCVVFCRWLFVFCHICYGYCIVCRFMASVYPFSICNVILYVDNELYIFIILFANFLHYPFISLDKRHLLIFTNLS
jgi:hypothetical protein